VLQLKKERFFKIAEFKLKQPKRRKGKMKKMMMVLVCVMLLSGLAIGNEANATTANPGWYNVIINSAGALTYNLGFIFATSSITAWPGQRLFLIDLTPDPSTGASAGKALLAAALTGNANQTGALYMPDSIDIRAYCAGIGAGTVE
jgi:hypothetical protein